MRHLPHLPLITNPTKMPTTRPQQKVALPNRSMETRLQNTITMAYKGTDPAMFLLVCKGAQCMLGGTMWIQCQHKALLCMVLITLHTSPLTWTIVAPLPCQPASIMHLVNPTQLTQSSHRIIREGSRKPLN